MNEQNAKDRWSVIEKYIPDNSIGVELGVFKGHLSPYFLKKNPKKLFLVDPWYRLGPEWSWVKNQDPSCLHAFQDILVNFEEQINSGVIIPVVEFSCTFLKGIDSKSLDFIYLDSSHSYEDTFNELSAASTALKDNGVLLGDDWHNDPTHRHYGVTKAVKEFVENDKCELLFEPVLAQWGVRFI